ncbi:MAG: hypothetical protein ACRDRJ_50410 [Streptosporangiaceae bacterium]
MGVGDARRRDDFAAAGTDPRTRGRRLDEQLAIMRRIWSGQPYEAGPTGPGPARPGGPEVLFGGFRPAAPSSRPGWPPAGLAVRRSLLRSTWLSGRQT